MKEPTKPVYDIEVLAREIRKWAQKNRMMANFQAVPIYDEPLIRTAFYPVGLVNATSIMQDRGISYVGIDDHKNEVIIFLQKPPRIKDIKAFEAMGRFDIPISIAAGGLGTAGKPAPPPTVVPFIFRNKKYTCGSSIYLSTHKGAGTLGCLIRDSSGRLYGLSNNHVTGGSNYAERTIPIFAPGQADIAAGQPDPFTIGHHYDAMPFIDGLPSIVDCSKNIDAAVFLITDENSVTSYQRDHFDTPSMSGALRAGMDVMKVGRTTGLTRGKVIARIPDPHPIQFEVDVVPGKKVVYFENLYAIQNPTTHFAMAGDSGSLIVTADPDSQKIAVGLVVATDGESLTLALSLDRILVHFGMEIVSSHNT